MTRKPVERRRKPRNDEEAAAFTTPELEKVECGELDEWWGGLRTIAKALGMPFPALMMEAEEFAVGKGHLPLSR